MSHIFLYYIFYVYNNSMKQVDIFYKKHNDFKLFLYNMDKSNIFIDDILHECLLKSLNINFNNNTELEVLKWFYVSIKNLFIDYKRKNINNSLNVDFLLQDNDDNDNTKKQYKNEITNNDIIEYNDIKLKILYNEINKLSKSYKNVITLYYIENLTHEEIANYLNISINTSKTNLKKGKDKLKKAILQYNLVH